MSRFKLNLRVHTLIVFWAKPEDNEEETFEYQRDSNLLRVVEIVLYFS